jgi:hypothetical protein
MLKYKYPAFIGKLNGIIIFNLCISILKFIIFIYTIICNIFLRDCVFIDKISNYYSYKIKDKDINKYYEIVLMDKEVVDKEVVDKEVVDNEVVNISVIREKIKYRNILLHCSLNEIDITEDVRKFINYYDNIDNIPWGEIIKYLILTNKIKNRYNIESNVDVDVDYKEFSILLIDDDFNEIQIII